MSGFSLSHIYLSDEELDTLMNNISSIISTVKNNKPNDKRKMRTIGIILSPPDNVQ